MQYRTNTEGLPVSSSSTTKIGTKSSGSQTPRVIGQKQSGRRIPKHLLSARGIFPIGQRNVFSFHRWKSQPSLRRARNPKFNLDHKRHQEESHQVTVPSNKKSREK